ncbi:MAG: ester cyclase [Actinobacteria bacterium]|nr:ester cyclase [Actinomycetota bacterium]
MTTTATSPHAKHNPPEGATPEELIRWTFDRINDHDSASLRQLWSNAVEYFPHAISRGPDEIAAYFDEVFAAMPDDFHLEIVKLIAEGDDVFVRWTMTGTFNGKKFQRIAATGSRIEVGGVDHFVIRDGQIVTNHVTFDQMNFARQLGLLPPHDSLADKGLKSLFNLKTRAAKAIKR